ncbi:MAG: 16S rRNA (adenine(1518)-N(6)/adenine(1519)-N(6))-dimethyltransferase RsmA [Clostridia bacterium]|nr:16S rRNA (adenine(1518)-N(6)/adenine(1519)-N(6))-dimethyltransferase RsmA [Clostridia bacterium]MBQ9924970.1 16S rRNA (adenine(1518)-N(6)/adenine(1519)-N(6))-dimethyltransferase RsmA [Clostridia bacterium]
MDLCNINVIKVLLAKHGFSFSKGLGQNFLCEASVPYDIAELAGIDEETCVLEVGPGIGTLTQELCKRAKKVVSIELDKRLPALLADTMGEFDNFTLVPGDILKVDIPAIVEEHFPNAKRIIACANLPYYITSPAIAALIDSKCFDSVTVMVQKEVADRICAEAGSAEYGAFTPYIAYNAQARVILDVGRECFIPSPKVDSAVVRMDLYKEPPVQVCSEKLFFRVVKAAFAQRRKTLLNCLGTGFGGQLTKDQLKVCMESCGISPSARGETLDIERFAALTNAIAEAMEG